MRRHHALLLILGALACASCRNSPTDGVIPTSPSLPAVAVAAPSGIPISGKVYDTGLRPLRGAVVEVLNGPSAGIKATTLATGEYSMVGHFDADTQFRATLAGHDAAARTLGTYCERCNPHYWVFFYLGLPTAPANLAGNYLLTVTADPACTALPPEASTRSYTAKIAAQDVQPTAANTFFRGVTDGASFVSGAWDGLWFAVAGDYIELTVGDLHGQPGVIEQIGSNQYVSFGGLGNVTLASPGTSNISMLFEGEIEYCVSALAPLDGDRRYTCSPARSDTRITCPSRKHQLTLAKR